MGALPAGELAKSSSPFAAAAGAMWGGSWTKIVAAVALAATFGCLNGWTILTARVPLAAAEDGLFPAAFAKVSGKHKTPVFGLVVSSVLVSGLMLMNYTKGLVDAFTFIILLATLTTLVPYAFSAAAQAHLYLTERHLFDVKNFVRDVTIATLAFVYSIWAITGSGKDVIAKGFGLLLAGVPVYILVRWWETRKTSKLTDTLKAPPPVAERPAEVIHSMKRASSR
jgi:APA family basic amino acid/polyamine antiporter